MLASVKTTTEARKCVKYFQRLQAPPSFSARQLAPTMQTSTPQPIKTCPPINTTVAIGDTCTGTGARLTSTFTPYAMSGMNYSAGNGCADRPVNPPSTLLREYHQARMSNNKSPKHKGGIEAGLRTRRAVVRLAGPHPYCRYGRLPELRGCVWLNLCRGRGVEPAVLVSRQGAGIAGAIMRPEGAMPPQHLCSTSDLAR